MLIGVGVKEPEEVPTTPISVALTVPLAEALELT
jgi:hypothetical protein